VWGKVNVLSDIKIECGVTKCKGGHARAKQGTINAGSGNETKKRKVLDRASR